MRRFRIAIWEAWRADINAKLSPTMQKQLEAARQDRDTRARSKARIRHSLHISIGLAVAMVAVYLLMAINFQTWGDPFVVIAALPLAFCGIVASLFISSDEHSRSLP